MSQAPNPFTQAASQGYGDFAPTLDDEDENHVDDEEQQQDDEVEGPQSPEPEEHDTDEHGFTQTQERSYPTGIESPDEDENADQIDASDHEEEQQQQPENDDDDEAGPSSPPNEDVDASNDQEAEEEEEEEEEDDEDTKKKQSQSRRRVQIMNDSDNEDEPQVESTSVVSKDKNRSFLKQFVTKPEHSPKKHKKRHSDEHRHHHHHEKKSKRFRKTSDDDEDNAGNEEEEEKEKETDNVAATSDVEDVVDDIFGKDVNENEEGDKDDQEEAAAELRDLQDDEAIQQDDEEEDVDQQEHLDAEEDDDESAQNASSSKGKNNIVYDIDLYLEKKAERRRGNRRRGGNNGDTIDLAGPDADKLVSKLIDQMKIATEEDRIFNKSRQPATAKLLLLPLIEQHLYRADLTEIFLDNGVLTVFKDWLSPLPDKSLPNIKIRESLIRILQQFGGINVDALRDSGIGKALMYLYKHPRETKENKIKQIKIIHDWARPIFNLDTDYKHLTREERQQRDADQASLKRQTSQTGKPKNRGADMDLPFASNKRQNNDDDMHDEEDCPRARVPRPSNKDYVVRPVSTVECSDKKVDGKKRTISRLDELKRRQQDRKRQSKPTSIVKLSIEGNKMHL